MYWYKQQHKTPPWHMYSVSSKLTPTPRVEVIHHNCYKYTGISRGVILCQDTFTQCLSEFL